MTTWSPDDLGRAMVAYVEAHAKHARRRSDGIEAEAFYRGGDNPSSLRVFEASGTWADPRDPNAPAKHGARDFAEHVAGMTLPAFMERWGSSAPAPRPRARRTAERGDRVAPADVAAVWAACLPLEEDADVAGWLSRKLTPRHAERVAARDLARVLPRGLWRPWLRVRGQGWDEAGFRLVVPLYGAAGRLEALHARRVDGEADGLPKTATPAGMTTRGRVMACELGARLLRGDRAATSHVLSVTRARARRGDGAAVVVAEGLTDYLAAAAGFSDADEDAPAVLGVVSGSWCAELAARVPDGVSMCIATDEDDDGDRYAASIAASLAPRIRGGRLGVTRFRRAAA